MNDSARTGDDAGLREAVAKAIRVTYPNGVPTSLNLADAAIAAVRSWDAANAGSAPVATVPKPCASCHGYGYTIHANFGRSACEDCNGRGWPAPGEAAAPVRDLAGDLIGVLVEYLPNWSQNRYQADKFAAKLTRLGWVHSSQATGGGLSGEARDNAIMAIQFFASHATVCDNEAMRAAIAELAALPVLPTTNKE